MAVALVVGFVLTSRQELRGLPGGAGMLLDGEGGIGVGANLGNAVWWTLPSMLLWALPVGVLGAAAGSARARRRRAREHGDLASTT